MDYVHKNVVCLSVGQHFNILKDTLESNEILQPVHSLIEIAIENWHTIMGSALDEKNIFKFARN